MTVYFISGLGADERAFKKIKLADTIEIIHVKWPEHDDDESLQSYCLKITKSIDTSKEFSLVGLSFGGIIAIELLKILVPKTITIISSVSTKDELPGYLKFLKRIKLYKIVPGFLMNKGSWFFNLSNCLGDKEDSELVRTIIRETNPYFIKWAIDKIVNWTNESRPKGLYHIHGDRDNTFPLSKVKADYVINGGGHLMVLTHAREISKKLNERLKNHGIYKASEQIGI
ncbi:hypothetical protein BH09BAC3_BH09BAC3_19060 [soil metagenome]